jgi:hypothetical protein
MNTDGNDLKHQGITRGVIGSLALRAEGLSVYRELPIKVFRKVLAEVKPCAGLSQCMEHRY